MTSAAIDQSVLTQADQLRQAIIAEVGRAYMGDPLVTETLLIALIGRGHVLIEGVPGIAKTTVVKAFSATLGCEYRRVQFTPDLLPSDITGTYVLDMRSNAFVLRRGPVFTNILLGDEINRAPAKTQSALLEAMQESQVTIEGETQLLDQPFMVLATQNPVEQEGTYPLPEAQVDRFLVKLTMRYPSKLHEKQMLTAYNQDLQPIRPLANPQKIIALQQLADDVHVADDVFEHILALVNYTRQHRQVYLGASPRAGLALLRASKALALLRGRGFVLPDDVIALAPVVLAHRIVMTPDAEIDGQFSTDIVNQALQRTPYKQSQSAS